MDRWKGEKVKRWKCGKGGKAERWNDGQLKCGLVERWLV